MRAIPNLYVFRPADAVETAEAWELAMLLTHAPSALCLSRQNLPIMRREHLKDNLSAKGAYVLREPDGGRDITLLATGSEVSLAGEAAEKLAAQGIKAAVVTIPCFELFAEQDEAYQAQVLGEAPRIGIEAGLRHGFESLLRPQDAFIGMKSFGASAPAGDLYRIFGITVDAVVTEAQTRLQKKN